METIQQIPFCRKISVKLAMYFALALFIFSLIVGTLFLIFFKDYSIRVHQKELQSRGEAIATTFSNFFSGDEPGRGMHGHGAYTRFINDISMDDVWIVNEDLEIIVGGNQGRRLISYGDLPGDAGMVVTRVFEGRVTFSEGFSSLLNVPTLTAGIPIMQGDSVTGAVLIHSPVEGIDEGYAQGIKIVSISLLLALAISLLLSLYLALSFTRPLKKMTKTSLALTKKDYTAKTGISQEDEIGMLAKSIDNLSVKLLEANKESEQLEQMRKDFISNISHELRTPVTVIRGSLEALYDDVVENPEKIKEYYSQMINESVHLQRLIQDLLDLSKLSNPQFKMEMSPVEWEDIIQDAIRSISYKAKDKEIHIELHKASKPDVFMGDYGRLRQMLLIFLDNSIKFSPENSIVHITLERDSFSVSDSGCGVPPERLPFIFDRFYHAESGENRQGSGLGLSIAKEIALRHKIRLSVKSIQDAKTTVTGKWDAPE